MTRVVNGVKMPRWTPAEEKRLVELIKLNVTYQDIATLMNRSLASVVNKVVQERAVLNIPSRRREYRAQ